MAPDAYVTWSMDGHDEMETNMSEHQMSLFAPTTPRPPVTYSPHEFEGVDVHELIADISADQYQGTMYGKVYDRPRLERWYHDDSARGYSFGGGAPVMPRPWTPHVRDIKTEVEGITGERFDSCFANVYRSGRDHIDWHADDESWIGPVIASVSIGAHRRFCLRPKDKSIEAPWVEYSLGGGDLLVMLAGCQDSWLHSIRKTAKPAGERVNLTFRQTRGAG